MELIATTISEGTHRSLRGGEGVEYHSSVPYSDGEDARRIDWKRYAATDRYFVNRFKRDEKSSWHIVLDNSSSMNYGTKSLWSRTWVGALLFLANAWGDRWRIWPDYEFAFEEVLAGLSRPGEVGISPKEFKNVSGDKQSRLLIVSDGFFPEDLLHEDFNRWEGEFKSIHFIQVVDPREVDFSFQGVLEFQDMESKEKLILDGQAAKKRYQKEFEHHQEFLKALTKKSGTHLVSRTGEPAIELQIQEFFDHL